MPNQLQGREPIGPAPLFRFMRPLPSHLSLIDHGRTFYGTVVKAVLCITALVAVKFLLLDTVLISTDQMSPALEKGDRCLILRSAIFPLSAYALQWGRVVLFLPPDGQSGKWGVLRIAAVGGDSIAIQNGVFINYTDPRSVRSQWTEASEPLPSSFSVRDWMSPFRLPRQGQIISLDSLNERDFFFVVNAIRQEEPTSDFTIATQLFVDGSEQAEYMVEDFSLYDGLLKNIPIRLWLDPLFCERLRSHISRRMPSTAEIALTHALLRNGVPVLNRRMHASCIFLLADDWKNGYDSRYFGPLSVKRVKGCVVIVLWSSDENKHGLAALRWRRFLKVVR